MPCHASADDDDMSAMMRRHYAIIIDAYAIITMLMRHAMMAIIIFRYTMTCLMPCHYCRHYYAIELWCWCWHYYDMPCHFRHAAIIMMLMLMPWCHYFRYYYYADAYAAIYAMPYAIIDAADARYWCHAADAMPLSLMLLPCWCLMPADAIIMPLLMMTFIMMAIIAIISDAMPLLLRYADATFIAAIDAYFRCRCWCYDDDIIIAIIIAADAIILCHDTPLLMPFSLMLPWCRDTLFSRCHADYFTRLRFTPCWLLMMPLLLMLMLITDALFRCFATFRFDDFRHADAFSAFFSLMPPLIIFAKSCWCYADYAFSMTFLYFADISWCIAALLIFAALF